MIINEEGALLDVRSRAPVRRRTSLAGAGKGCAMVGRIISCIGL